MTNDISILQCLSEGWEQFKRHYWLTLGGLLIIYLIYITVALIPYFLPIFSFTIAPALSPGIYLLSRNIAQESNPSLGDLFAGFRRYGLLFRLALLTGGVTLIGCLPTFIVFGFTETSRIWLGIPDPDGPNLRMTFFFLANSFALWFLLYRYWLIYFVVMDEPQLSLSDSLARSSQLVKGNGHNLLLGFFAAIFILTFLLVLLILPAIFIGPFTLIAFARFYIKLKEMHDEPIAQTDNPAIVS